MNDIIIPADATQAFFDDGAVTLIVEPPNHLPPQGWRGWADDAFVLPVADVRPFAENGRQLLRVFLGRKITNRGNRPQEFRLCSITSLPQQATPERINFEAKSGHPWREAFLYAPATAPEPPKSEEFLRATCPVRVDRRTHARLKELSAETGKGIAGLIAEAVARQML